jgi:hypothetical protein
LKSKSILVDRESNDPSLNRDILVESLSANLISSVD